MATDSDRNAVGQAFVPLAAGLLPGLAMTIRSAPGLPWG